MKKIAMTRVLVALAAFAVCGAPVSSGWAKAAITADAAVESLASLKQYYEVPNFRIGGAYDLDRPESWENGGEGGVTLESLGAGPLRIGYITQGTPKVDEQGKIINAVIVSSYYSSDATNMYNFWVDGQAGNAFSKGAIIGPGKLIDTNRYYVVLLDALGLWGASKPSGGLGMKFPQYSYFDMVQANYRLLRDHLNIAQVELATGVSMGATQTYVWGLLHSGFVKTIMPIGGTTQSDGGDPVGNWTFQLATAAIESDPVWRETGGNYYDLPKDQHPNQGVAFSWSVLGMTGFDLAYRSTQSWDAVQKEVFFWKPTGDESAGVMAKTKDYDAVDLFYRNAAGNTYNINADLHRITARTLVIHVENDLWLNITKARAAVDRIPGAQLVTLTSPIAHYAVFSALNTEADNVILDTFLRDTGVIADPERTFVAANYRSPRVTMKPDPEKGFWKEQFTYPFPVKYATGKDSRGESWEIGYMDEYNGSDPNPPVLMIIHGKGAFGAHYGYLMKYALERGLRVIVPDMPHYGVSGPGNLDKSPARTLQDARDAIHDVVVNQLGVKQAYCLGHSLGGQFCLGYALSYTDAVAGLILEAPAGLEEFPKELDMGGDKPAPLFDPSYAHDFAKWKKVWGPTGILDSEMNKSAEDVRAFFYFQKRDPETGALSPSTAGYFVDDTEYARLHTDQRVAIIDADKAEYEQYVNAFIYDVYSIGSELVKGDPDNLYQRLTDIKVPILLLFGNEEPFIPSTALNGLQDMARDVIIPFMNRMTEAGNRPVLKLYPGVGHFIHTDVPYEFANDSVDFVLTGRVEVMTDPVVDFMVNPRKAIGAAVVSTTAGGGPVKSAGGKLNK